MTNKAQTRFLGDKHDCYFATDPRVNKELAASLQGKNIVCAGAGRGVGRACAEFLTYASAKSISLVALELEEVEETAKLCKDIKPEIKTKVAGFDVKDSDAVNKFIKEVDQEFGSVDVVLMNAGRPPQWLHTVECDPDIWWDTVAVSLQGAFNFARFALPIMQRQKSGVIIFTSSAGAHSNIRLGSYTMGKLGMIRLAEILHHENFKDYNIKAFAYNPGRVETRFFTDFRDKVQGKSNPGSYVIEGVPNEDKSAETVVKAFDGVTWDTPQMAAGLVTVLASGKLDFMSGRYLDASRDIEKYIEDEKTIRANDLHRVRLHVADDWFVPTLDF
ncbi:uncharacterized protein A1O5_12905 [Cladophialophora psammophila CBS 110553]|uniref:3-oxoacyl-[acyl-carrier protein] reductase n=1 Tax=Cladophialophora psammophila CBS 110553 TaxID=1182543 RepID=W9W8H8_9EURO|nr:uncharacterized protein A1O5_12905 [Cladophialophora psammophila CBS 110553]EXJ54839.1 hypothetical protein A1O5_12905 [Cladophialophora psammophila CBS 110553]